MGPRPKPGTGVSCETALAMMKAFSADEVGVAK
jgi:hypothetical protein